MLKTVESIRKNSNRNVRQNNDNSRQLASNLVPGEGWAGETQYSFWTCLYFPDLCCKA